MPEKVKTDRDLLLDEIKGLINDSQKENVDKKTLEAHIEEINKQLKVLNEKPNNHEEVKSLKEAVEKLTTEVVNVASTVKALNETPGKKADEKPLTFRQSLWDAIENTCKDVPSLVNVVKDNEGERKSLNDYFSKMGNKTSPSMTIKFPVDALTRKLAVDMTETAIVGSNVNIVRMTELDPNRVGIPLTIYPHVTEWMPSRTISRKTLSLLVVGTYVEGAGTKTEGSAPGQSSFLLTTVEFPSFYIATYFKFSDETYDDLAEVIDEISVTGPDKVLDNVDSQILGTVGNDSTAIAGLFTASKKTAFAATWNGTVPAASTVDLIEKMKLQCENNKYRPDAVVINPTDLSAIGADKDQLDNSKNDRRVVYSVIGEPTFVCGLRIVKSTALTADTLAVLDSKQVLIGKRKDMSMEIGYDSDDFKVGKKTVIIKVRLAFGVRDAAAVIYSSALATAVDLLKKV